MSQSDQHDRPPPPDPYYLGWKLEDLNGDVERLFDRTRGVGDHGRRIENIEKAREEDRREIAQEIGDLRRTIIQAMVSVFVAAIGVLVVLALAVK